MSEFEKHKISNPSLPFIFHNYHVQNSVKSGNNWHENIEILCIAEGTATIVNNGQTYFAKAGDTAVIDKNALHFIHATSELKYYCLIIDHTFCIENHFNVDNIHFSPLITDDELSKLIKQFHKVNNDKENPYRYLELRSLLLSIALLLCKRHSNAFEVEHEDTRILYAIKQVIERIHSEYQTQLTLDDLAKTAGINRSYLSRSFHRITGYTVMEYINHTRCEKAKKLLENKEAKIEQIAQQCGFENTSYFYRTFLKVTGVRPGQYRSKLLNKAE